MRKLFSLFTFMLLFSTFALAQATVEIPLNMEDNQGNSNILTFGLDETATGGIDLTLGEAELPPLPPNGVFDVRFVSNAEATLGEGSLKDIRNASSFPYSGTYTHQIKFQPGIETGGTITINWDLPPEIVSGSVIHDLLGGVLYDEPFTGTGSLTVTNPGVINQLEIIIVYDNIGPSGPEPGFSIAPASLDFGPVAIGNSADLQATVTNTGDADLIISDVTSSDLQFTFAPNTFPITVTPGSDQIFTVTFAPTAAGVQTADFVFTHNAAGSPVTYSVQGEGLTLAPVFSISPASLDFGDVVTGDNATLQATVTNNGNEDLIINDVTSSDLQFTFSPTAFPITLTPGNSQIFDVTFAPTAFGTQTATLQFIHNASGSPTNYSVHGVGLNPGPVFNVNPTSLNFGTVNVGNSSDLTVTVTNTGATNDLNISNAAIAEAGFSVAPTTATIPAGGSQNFTVTFAPTADGPYTGSLVFTDDAAGSPHSVALSGTGYVPPAMTGLIFENSIVHQPENASYTETMQLIGVNFGGASINAIQFRLVVNTETDDENILTFQKIEKGTNLTDPNWVLDYNVIRGPITPNGASVDTILVLLYNLNQNAMPPNDYDNLF